MVYAKCYGELHAKIKRAVARRANGKVAIITHPPKVYFCPNKTELPTRIFSQMAPVWLLLLLPAYKIARKDIQSPQTAQLHVFGGPAAHTAQIQ